MGILLIWWGEHACLPARSPGTMLWSLHQDGPAVFTGVWQEQGRIRGSKPRGQLGLLDVGLLPQDLHLSRSQSLSHCPESFLSVGKGGYGGRGEKLEHGSHQQKWQLTCSLTPRPSSVLRGAPDPAARAVFWTRCLMPFSWVAFLTAGRIKR